jgi:hypothetical protein
MLMMIVGTTQGADWAGTKLCFPHPASPRTDGMTMDDGKSPLVHNSPKGFLFIYFW